MSWVRVEHRVCFPSPAQAAVFALSINTTTVSKSVSIDPVHAGAIYTAVKVEEGRSKGVRAKFDAFLRSDTLQKRLKGVQARVRCVPMAGGDELGGWPCRAPASESESSSFMLPTAFARPSAAQKLRSQLCFGAITSLLRMKSGSTCDELVVCTVPPLRTPCSGLRSTESHIYRVPPGLPAFFSGQWPGSCIGGAPPLSAACPR
jgi:hypothetical protein